MLFRPAVAGIALALSLSSPGNAQSILGYGIMPCAEVVSVIQREPFRGQLVAWLGGYMSGVNAMLVARDKLFVDLSGMKNIDIIVGHLIARCSANPNQQMTEAADQILLSLPTKPFKPRQ